MIKDATNENELMNFELLKHINDKGYRRFKLTKAREKFLAHAFLDFLASAAASSAAFSAGLLD